MGKRYPPDAEIRKFTCPAGVLTLLRICGWGHHEDLLDRVELSRYDGLWMLTETWEEPPGGSSEQTGFIYDTLKAWLAKCPEGPLEPGLESVDALAAMIGAWSTGLTHALATEPRTFHELERALTAIEGIEPLEEHIDLLVNTGQAEAIPGNPHRHKLTEWGAEALAPLIAATQRETHLPEEDILAPVLMDVEATFKLLLPKLSLSPQLSGACQLGVHVERDEEPIVAGVSIDIEKGRVVESSTLLETEPETWLRGTAREWCDAVVDPEGSPPIPGGGNTELTAAIVAGLHEQLFGS